MAQQIASISNSMTAYRVSTSYKKREPAWMGVHLHISLFLLFGKAKPLSTGICAQIKCVIWLMSKKESSGKVVYIQCFDVGKAF